MCDAAADSPYRQLTPTMPGAVRLDSSRRRNALSRRLSGYEWGEPSDLAAMKFLQTVMPGSESTPTQWMPWVVNHAYGEHFNAKLPAGLGDWSAGRTGLMRARVRRSSIEYAGATPTRTANNRRNSNRTLTRTPTRTATVGATPTRTLTRRRPGRRLWAQRRPDKHAYSGQQHRCHHYRRYALHERDAADREPRRARPGLPVLVAGDLVDNGTLSEFQNCWANGYGKFNSRMYPVMGNHDTAADTIPISIASAFQWAPVAKAGGRTIWERGASSG